jgi:hypothetical protein
MIQDGLWVTLRAIGFGSFDMTKGFGPQKDEVLGYVLLVLPEAGAFAARFTLGMPGETFIGIVNILNEAQVWKKQKDVERDLEFYLEFLIEQAPERDRDDVKIQRLVRSAGGELRSESVKTIRITSIAAS